MEDMDVKGRWTVEEQKLHINVLELKAVVNTMRHFREHLQHKVVVVVTDNSTAVAYIQKQGGTRSRQLFLVLQELFWLAESNELE